MYPSESRSRFSQDLAHEYVFYLGLLSSGQQHKAIYMELQPRFGTRLEFRFRLH